MAVPDIRIRPLNDRPVRRDGRFVVYWMTAARRTTSSFALERSVEHALSLGKPLVVLEALRTDYRWASDRLHRFVIEGMADHARAFADQPALYHPYVEPAPGAGRGLLAALGEMASVIVTDDYPCFFLPGQAAAAAAKVDVRIEAVDGNGILPLRSEPKVHLTAHSFRRALQRMLPEHLRAFPRPRPLDARLARPDALPAAITRRWPAADRALLGGGAAALAPLPIDHTVGRAAQPGGPVAARSHLDAFLESGLARYDVDRNQPDRDGASGLSPYLHFGHIGAHEILAAIFARTGFSPDRLAPISTGALEGWWGLPPAVEAYLDQLVTWRELGFNMSAKVPGYSEYSSLPAWARASLDRHAHDPREHLYDLADFEAAATHDELWNAAQTQLVREGRMHNYLRMLWGKKILEWTSRPEDALAIMIELNNKYAVDGRDPNSYSGIFWVLGRYDRPWGPERPVYGVIRYMSSANTVRKLRVKEYLARYGRGLFDGG